MLLNKRIHQNEKPSNLNEDPTRPKNKSTDFFSRQAPTQQRTLSVNSPSLCANRVQPLSPSPPAFLASHSHPTFSLPPDVWSQRVHPCALSLCLADSEFSHLSPQQSLPCPPYLSNPPQHHITLRLELPLQQFYFCFVITCFVSVPCRTLSLSSPSRDRTGTPCSGSARTPKHWTAWEKPVVIS